MGLKEGGDVGRVGVGNEGGGGGMVGSWKVRLS